MTEEEMDRTESATAKGGVAAGSRNHTDIRTVSNGSTDGLPQSRGERRSQLSLAQMLERQQDLRKFVPIVAGRDNRQECGAIHRKQGRRLRFSAERLRA